MTSTRWFAVLIAFALVVSPYAVLSGEKKKEGDKGIDDAKFVMKASESDMTEIAMGKLASQQAVSPSVRKFAMKMVEDHTKSSKDLMEIVKKNGMKTANHMSKKHQEMLDKLTSTKGADFDRLYMKGQLKAHEEAVKLFMHESNHGHDADVKAFAGKVLPVIQGHLKMAKEITYQ
jgi:putative membrane protein